MPSITPDQGEGAGGRGLCTRSGWTMPGLYVPVWMHRYPHSCF